MTKFIYEIEINYIISYIVLIKNSYSLQNEGRDSTLYITVNLAYLLGVGLTKNKLEISCTIISCNDMQYNEIIAYFCQPSFISRSKNK